MTPKTTEQVVQIQVSRFDSLNAFLIASIILTATFVAVLFLIWLCLNSVDTAAAKEAELIPATAVMSNDSKIEFLEFADAPAVDFANQLLALTEAVSAVRVSRDRQSGQATNAGGPLGDRRQVLPPGDLIAEHQRWKINYRTDNIDQYRSQLDYFGIDLGLVHIKTNQIQRLQSPGTANAKLIDTNRGEENKAGSLFFTHESRVLIAWDEFLLREQIDGWEHCITVQFYPEKTRQLMREVEQKYLADNARELNEVKRTVFKINKSDDGFALEVASVEWL